MAVAKKGARNITVNEVRYRWRATGNDGWISLVVWPHNLPGDKLVTHFGYHQTPVPQPPIPMVWKGEAIEVAHTAMVGQLVITNRLVRRVVLHAVSTGYRPDVKTKDGQRNLGPAEPFVEIGDAVRGK